MDDNRLSWMNAQRGAALEEERQKKLALAEADKITKAKDLPELEKQLLAAKKTNQNIGHDIYQNRFFKEKMRMFQGGGEGQSQGAQPSVLTPRGGAFFGGSSGAGTQDLEELRAVRKQAAMAGMQNVVSEADKEIADRERGLQAEGILKKALRYETSPYRLLSPVTNSEEYKELTSAVPGAKSWSKEPRIGAAINDMEKALKRPLSEHERAVTKGILEGKYPQTRNMSDEALDQFIHDAIRAKELGIQPSDLAPVNFEAASPEEQRLLSLSESDVSPISSRILGFLDVGGIVSTSMRVTGHEADRIRKAAGLDLIDDSPSMITSLYDMVFGERMRTNPEDVDLGMKLQGATLVAAMAIQGGIKGSAGGLVGASIGAIAGAAKGIGTMLTASKASELAEGAVHKIMDGEGQSKEDKLFVQDLADIAGLGAAGAAAGLMHKGIPSSNSAPKEPGGKPPEGKPKGILGSVMSKVDESRSRSAENVGESQRGGVESKVNQMHASVFEKASRAEILTRNPIGNYGEIKDLITRSYKDVAETLFNTHEGISEGARIGNAALVEEISREPVAAVEAIERNYQEFLSLQNEMASMETATPEQLADLQSRNGLVSRNLAKAQQNAIASIKGMAANTAAYYESGIFTPKSDANAFLLQGLSEATRFGSPVSDTSLACATLSDALATIEPDTKAFKAALGEYNKKKNAFIKEQQRTARDIAKAEAARQRREAQEAFDRERSAAVAYNQDLPLSNSDAVLEVLEIAYPLAGSLGDGLANRYPTAIKDFAKALNTADKVMRENFNNRFDAMDDTFKDLEIPDGRILELRAALDKIAYPLMERELQGSLIDAEKALLRDLKPIIKNLDMGDDFASVYSLRKTSQKLRQAVIRAPHLSGDAANVYKLAVGAIEKKISEILEEVSPDIARDYSRLMKDYAEYKSAIFGNTIVEPWFNKKKQANLEDLFNPSTMNESDVKAFHRFLNLPEAVGEMADRATFDEAKEALSYAVLRNKLIPLALEANNIDLATTLNRFSEIVPEEVRSLQFSQPRHVPRLSEFIPRPAEAPQNARIKAYTEIPPSPEDYTRMSDPINVAKLLADEVSVLEGNEMVRRSGNEQAAKAWEFLKDQKILERITRGSQNVKSISGMERVPRTALSNPVRVNLEYVKKNISEAGNRAYIIAAKGEKGYRMLRDEVEYFSKRAKEDDSIGKLLSLGGMNILLGLIIKIPTVGGWVEKGGAGSFLSKKAHEHMQEQIKKGVGFKKGSPSVRPREN